MKPKRLAVVHWFPIEYYPPVTNLLNCFTKHSELQIECFTSHNTKNRPPYTNAACRIHRTSFPRAEQNPIIRLWRYLTFPLMTMTRLLWFRPHSILYIEPQSVLPVFLYSLLARRCRILIHNHEYHDQHQFLRPGMRLVRGYHWLERKFIFPRAEWISQTNEDRIRLFKSDFPKIDPAKIHELPNLPPAEWRDTPNKAWAGNATPLKLVYVGSLSCKDTFIKEISEWIEADPANSCALDVYSYNRTPDVDRLFEACNSARVNFYGDGIPYEKLPEVLSQYHVGLILYKATTTNYVFNASNKLFEYLALGLDVWFPQQMLGVKPYARMQKSPRVVELNFDELSSLDLTELRQRNHLKNDVSPESCETALTELKSTILAGSSK